MEDARSSYKKVYDAVEAYVKSYKGDFITIRDMVVTRHESYLEYIGELRNTLLHHIERMRYDLRSFQFISEDGNRDVYVSPHLSEELKNLQNIAEIFWTNTIKFNATSHNNSPGNMFVVESMSSCNNTCASFVDALGEIIEFINITLFETTEEKTIRETIEKSEKFVLCSSEYMNMLKDREKTLKTIDFSLLEDILDSMRLLIDNININDLRAQLLQDQRSFEESLIGYYEGRSTKLNLTDFMARDRLDLVTSHIENFFFNTDVRLLIPFDTHVINTKAKLIEFYNVLVEVLASLNGYYSSEIYQNTLYGFNIWRRALVSLSNNLLDKYDTSTGHETLGENFILNKNEGANSLNIIINEHISSYYENIFAEVKEMEEKLNEYNSNLAGAVDDVNLLLKKYKESGVVGNQFIRYDVVIQNRKSNSVELKIFRKSYI